VSAKHRMWSCQSSEPCLPDKSAAFRVGMPLADSKFRHE
jgi:hypothetical protein